MDPNTENVGGGIISAGCGVVRPRITKAERVGFVGGRFFFDAFTPDGKLKWQRGYTDEDHNLWTNEGYAAMMSLLTQSPAALDPVYIGITLSSVWQPSANSGFRAGATTPQWSEWTDYDGGTNRKLWLNQPSDTVQGTQLQNGTPLEFTKQSAGTDNVDGAFSTNRQLQDQNSSFYLLSEQKFAQGEAALAQNDILRVTYVMALQ